MPIAASVEFFSRSARARVFDFLARNPTRQFGLNELSREAGIPVATVWNAVRDLSTMGLATRQHARLSVQVGFNHKSPAARALAKAQLPDPHRMAFEAFA